MRKIVAICGVLCVAAFPLYAQEWTSQDSLRLRKLLDGEGEVKLNRELLKELETGGATGAPKAMTEKSWLDFNLTLPAVLRQEEPRKKVVLTLRPYTANTKYNWDPVYQKKIKVDKDTWRGDRFYALKQQTAKGWPQSGGGVGIGGLDLMLPFTRQFWDVKGRKRRARTLEVLRAYGDSITVYEK